MIRVNKIEPSYVTIREHRGAPAPGAPMVPMPMQLVPICKINAQCSLIHTLYQYRPSLVVRGDSAINNTQQSEEVKYEYLLYRIHVPDVRVQAPELSNG